jgi:hypothetical protein
MIVLPFVAFVECYYYASMCIFMIIIYMCMHKSRHKDLILDPRLAICVLL